MRRQIRLDAIRPAECHRQEIERLLQALVRLRAAETQEAGAGVAEALAAEAGDTEVVVGALEQIQRQAVAR